MIKKVDRTIFVGCYSNKEAEHLKEMLAKRLRQTYGVNTIQDARDCLTVKRVIVLPDTVLPDGDRPWWEIHLAPKSKRPVKKFDLSRKMMREFLRGVIQGERSAKKVDCQVR